MHDTLLEKGSEMHEDQTSAQTNKSQLTEWISTAINCDSRRNVPQTQPKGMSGPCNERPTTLLDVRPNV
jgi:hypothetical protein